MMTHHHKKLYIIGVGDDGLSGLSPDIVSLINHAKYIYGGVRHLNMIDDNDIIGKKCIWQKVIEDDINTIKKYIADNTQQYVCVLASGNPLHYGVAKKILSYCVDGTTITHDDIDIIPHHSIFTLASAYLHWSLEDCTLLTIHGRTLSQLVHAIQPNAKLLVLTSHGKDVKNIAQYLQQHHISINYFYIMEHLGGEKQQCYNFNNLDDVMNHNCFADLNVVALHITDDLQYIHRPYITLSDDHFIHDGKMTKQDIRAITLNALCPAKNLILWDLGAGAGSIAIEWARYGGITYAVEYQEKRIKMIQDNIKQLAITNCNIIKGKSLDVIADLPIPDAIFIGGGICDKIIKQSLNTLRSYGRLVVNSITLESEQILIQHYLRTGGHIKRLHIEHGDAVGHLNAWRPSMSVCQWIYQKNISEKDMDKKTANA